MKANGKILVSLAGTVLIVLVGVALLLRAFGQIERAGAVRQQSYLGLIGANDLLSGLKDAETGYRGYLLTRDEAFLQPYLMARDTLQPSLQALRRTDLSPAAREHLDQIVPLMATRLAGMEQSIGLRRRRAFAPADMEVAIVQGKRWMDLIRAELKAFTRIEEAELAQRVAAYQSRLRTMLGLICATSVLTLTLALLFATLFYREAQRRVRNLVLLETRQLLDRETELNRELKLANATLQENLTRRGMAERELQSALLAAEAANLAKSNFLSSMSHELRTPLNAILGFAQLLESDTPPPRPGQKGSIDHILKAGWHLLSLINEILDLSKIESGQTALAMEPVALAEVLAECRGMIEHQAGDRGITLLFPAPGLLSSVMGDRTRVKQVLLNLLSNAVKYNAAQGTVAVRCFENTPGRVRVAIRDFGEGLRPDQLAQLFQPFNRLGQEAGPEEGSGIGLVVAKRLVELMEGVIGAESTFGSGCEFWFELPAAPVI